MLSMCGRFDCFRHLSRSRGETIYEAIFDAAPCLQSLFVTPRAVQAVRLMNKLAPSWIA